MSADPPRKKRPRPPTPEEMAAERVSSRRNGYIVFAVLSVLMPALFFINLMRDRHRNDMEMGLVPAKSPSAEPNNAAAGLKVLANENELAITPVVAKPSRHDVAFSIGSVLGDAKDCLASGIQSVQVTWQVNPDGSATDVNGGGPGKPPGDEEAFACVAAAVKQAHVAPFDGPPVHVTYTFRR